MISHAIKCYQQSLLERITPYTEDTTNGTNVALEKGGQLRIKYSYPDTK